MNKDQNLINEFAIKTLKENLNVMYAQIWREGQLTAEYKRMPVKTRLNTWSACKGVVSCAVGIALDEGLIQLDETTLDWIRYFFENAKVVNKPGTQWLYSNFNTYMISCAIEKRAGVNLLEYLRNRFFEPLGIGNPDWTLCPKGHVHAANGLYVNIDEFTRYGQLILHKGKYNGKQLVPEEYMKVATSNLVDNSAAGSPGNLYSGFGYGYQFVMNPEAGSYRSDGNYGQFCLAFPDKDAVVTVMSLEGDFQKIGNHLWTTVVPEL